MGEHVKLKTVLNNLLNRDFKISNEQRNAIIKNARKEVSVIDKLTTNTHIYNNWLERALQHWQREEPSKQALIFFIDVLIELSKNKINFILLHQNNIFKGIIHVINSKDFQDCDIFRSYIQFLDSFTHTEFGRNWLCCSFDYWKNVFKVIPSRKYTEDLSIFLKDLFLSVFNFSKLFLIDLSTHILNPLTSVCSRIRQNDLHGLLEENLHIELIPTMELVSSTIMCISESVTLDNEWLNCCSNLLILQKPLTILLEILKEEELTFELSKLLIALNYLEIKQCSKNPHEFIDLFMDNAVKYLDLNGSREYINNITILSYHLQRFRFNICRLVKVEDLNLSFSFDVCLYLYQTIAIIGICLKVQGSPVLFLKNDEIREQKMLDIMKKMKKCMGRSMYELVKLLLKMDIIPEAHLALDYLDKSINLFDKECKILSYSAILYLLGDIVEDIHKTKSLVSRCYDCGLITHLIYSFIFYATRCNVTWKDDKSIMLALDTVTDLLQIQNLPNYLIVAALKMLDLAIDKRMAPNLILLVESNSMLSIGPIGEILETNLNSESEEVRCAASKVLLTISESAKSKYPFFQELILDYNMCQILVENVFSNEVVEVRANALKCLQHLVRIEEIWNIFCAIPDILVTLINSLKIENKNLLRAEMVILVTVIYEQDYFTDLLVENVYEIMRYFGVHDFDVAVRINTLKFWDVVIQKLLIDEGMIDNKFPDVTFSKNSKKIVILDQNEIQRRLRRFMRKLSELGCLNILNSCFNSKDKFEKQYAIEIVTNLLTILEKYDIDEDNVDFSPKLNYRGNIQDVLEPENLSPRNFLQNITQEQINNSNNVNILNFTLILDEILKDNNLDELDSMDSYLC